MAEASPARPQTQTSHRGLETRGIGLFAPRSSRSLFYKMEKIHLPWTVFTEVKKNEPVTHKYQRDNLVSFLSVT